MLISYATKPRPCARIIEWLISLYRSAWLPSSDRTGQDTFTKTRRQDLELNGLNNCMTSWLCKCYATADDASAAKWGIWLLLTRENMSNHRLRDCRVSVSSWSLTRRTFDSKIDNDPVDGFVQITYL